MKNDELKGIKAALRYIIQKDIDEETKDEVTRQGAAAVALHGART